MDWRYQILVAEFFSFGELTDDSFFPIKDIKENPLQKVNKRISYHFSGWRQRTRSGMNYCPCIKAIWKKKIGTKSKNTILNKFIFFHSIISFYRFFIHLFIHSFIHSSAQPFWGNITIFSLIAISTIPGTERQAV